MQQRTGTLAENVRSLQRDLETAKASYDKDHHRIEGRRKEEQAELVMWKERCGEMDKQLKQQREQLRNAAPQRNQAEVGEAYFHAFALGLTVSVRMTMLLKIYAMSSLS